MEVTMTDGINHAGLCDALRDWNAAALDGDRAAMRDAVRWAQAAADGRDIDLWKCVTCGEVHATKGRCPVCGSAEEADAITLQNLV